MYSNLSTANSMNSSMGFNLPTSNHMNDLFNMTSSDYFNLPPPPPGGMGAPFHLFSTSLIFTLN